MADDERSPLLPPQDRRLSKLIQRDEDASSIVKSHVTVEEMKMSETAVGERLPYNDYTTIDWLHDLVTKADNAQMHRTDKSDRSRTRIVSASSTAAKAFEPRHSPSSIRLLDGSQQLSSAL